MKRLISAVAIVLASIYIFLGVFGMSLSIGHNGDDRQMAGCPFKGDVTVICQMTLADHIMKWKNMFLVSLQSVSEELTLFFAYVMLMLSIYIAMPPWAKRALLLFLPRYHRRENLNTRLFNPLALAFSDGILHSRIYA